MCRGGEEASAFKEKQPTATACLCGTIGRGRKEGAFDSSTLPRQVGNMHVASAASLLLGTFRVGADGVGTRSVTHPVCGCQCSIAAVSESPCSSDRVTKSSGGRVGRKVAVAG